jgi:hypothetical protein
VCISLAEKWKHPRTQPDICSQKSDSKTYQIGLFDLTASSSLPDSNRVLPNVPIIKAKEYKRVETEKQGLLKIFDWVKCHVQRGAAVALAL